MRAAAVVGVAEAKRVAVGRGEATGVGRREAREHARAGQRRLFTAVGGEPVEAAQRFDLEVLGAALLHTALKRYLIARGQRGAGEQAARQGHRAEAATAQIAVALGLGAQRAPRLDRRGQEARVGKARIARRPPRISHPGVFGQARIDLHARVHDGLRWGAAGEEQHRQRGEKDLTHGGVS